MNPLKTLFNKVFESTPTVHSADLPKEEPEFEWNPDEETVAPTSARAVSWRRDDTPDEAPRRVLGEVSAADMAASDHHLPAPTFERGPAPPRAVPKIAADSIQVPRTEASVSPAEEAPFIAARTATPPVAETAPFVLVPVPAPVHSQAPAPAAAVVPSARPAIPLSDFEDIYRKAGIKSPVHGYGVERVYRLITSRRLAGLDQSVRRSALLIALDAAGVPASDVSQDAVLRRKALTAYEAEKALELQSLRSRNESRAEALQDTVETFTRQKQSQIERLAQGSTSAVRAQSDLEIRKRMEQDRLFRSLAYFVEALPSAAVEVRGGSLEAPRVIERFDATIEMSFPAMDEAPGVTDTAVPAALLPLTPPPEAEVVTVTPEEMDAHTRPISLAAVDMTLRLAAEGVEEDAQPSVAGIENVASENAEASPKPGAARKSGSKS